MTLDEQHKFFLERPSENTILQINSSRTSNSEPNWLNNYNYNPDLGQYKRWEVRWKPKPKTVPDWPDVKPYWVRFIHGNRIRPVESYDLETILVSGASYRLEELAKGWEWTTDFKTWHPFTKEVEE